MTEKKVVSLEDRIPTIKEHRRRKANRRLIFVISVFFFLIACVVYFQSPLSHIQSIRVAGASSIPKKDVIKKSGIAHGENMWKVDLGEAAARLKKDPEIKDAKLRRGFPNKIYIEVGTYRRVAYAASGTSFRPVLENGAVLRREESFNHSGAPILTGFIKSSHLKEIVGQLKKLDPAIINAMSEICYTPKKTDGYHITVYMNDGFEVSATMRTFAEKMALYPSIISQLDPSVKGVIDLEVGSFFKAYKTEGEPEDDQKTPER